VVHPRAHRAGAPAAAPTATRPAPRPRLRRSLSKPDLIDLCLAAVVGLCVLLVHDAGYLLRHSFWVDEGWVAETVRARIGLVPSLAASTPLGWTFLLRLVPFGGPDRLRLVPLAFAGLAAAAGYLFGRELRLAPYVTGLLTGAAALLSPAMLVRDDLKQYTAEAFACLVVWVLVARIENEWRVGRLVAIAATASVGMLFADTVIFVGVAAMAGLALECLVTRHYRRLVAVAAAAAGMLAVALVIYETLIRPQVSPILVHYWRDYYMPRNASAAVSFLNLQLHHLASAMGFRWLIADAAAALAGIAALVWLRRFALAAMFPIMLAIVIAASAAGKYPFGDLRTSTFWLVMVPVLAAVAVAAVGRWAAAAIDRRAPLVVAAVALAAWVPATNAFIRSHPIPDDDVQYEVSYLDAHFRPGDVVIVNYGASFGFAYYYPPEPSFPVGHGPNGHLVAYPRLPWMVVMGARTPEDVANALADARAKIAAEPPGARGQIWIVRSQLTVTERRAWRRDLARYHVTTIHVGPQPLLLLRP